MSTILWLVLLCQVQEHSLVVSEPTVPPANALETQWSKYVADQWNPTFGRVNVWTEHVLADGSRIDIYVVEGNHTEVWETERAEKWKESIGQVYFYKIMSDADDAGVVLITLDDEKDKLYILRCAMVCRKLGIKFKTVDEYGVIR